MSLSSVFAFSFSPPNLVFNLSVDEQGCKNITITSDSQKITLSDKWAENKDINWNPSLFSESSSYHGLSFLYKNELLSNEREVEVCLSGDNIGEYHGIILLSEEQVGNSVVQMGIWIKAVISDKTVENKITSVDTQQEDKEIKNSDITGAVIGSGKQYKSIFLVILIVAIILILAIITYLVYDKRKEKEYF